MINLTQDERRAVLFLIAIALAGLTANFLVKKYSPSKNIASFSQDIGKINLNTADKNLLISAPGIGEKLAGRIIEYRQRQQNFYSKEELKNIKGITNYRYEKIKDLFIVR